MGVTPRAKVYSYSAAQPQPPLAELAPLEDIGRVLPWAEQTPPPQSALGLVAGEIGEITAPVAKPRE